MIFLAGAALMGMALSAQAFPALDLRHMERIAAVANSEDLKVVRAEAAQRRQTTFDASQQLISTSGLHAWVAPNFDAGDQRGPCPGLNSLANHGYIPHNGVATIQEIIDATGNVFGMALDLSTFLAVYGTVFDGNPISLAPGFSIGGAPPAGLASNLLSSLGLLGQPQGLSGSHNKYESDASTTRGDLHITGNTYEVQVPFFTDFYNSLIPDVPSAQQYTGFAEHHIGRFDHSVNTNGYFFFSPFSGLLVTPAGWSFPCQMMSNHSEEYPTGSLTGDILKSFFSITGDPDDFQYTLGHERIPDNWYRRAANDFSIPAFLLDVLEHGLLYPRLLSVTANTGEPNTLVVLDLGNITGGVYNVATLTEGNNLFCFALQIIQAVSPDVLSSTFADPRQAALPILDQVSDLVSQYACPQISAADLSLYDDYPGYDPTQGAV